LDQLGKFIISIHTRLDSRRLTTKS